MAREAHEVHHHHYHADGTEMTAAQVKNMKREVAGMDVALEAVTWKEGAKAGPDVNGKFYCMGPHGWKNYCGP